MTESNDVSGVNGQEQVSPNLGRQFDIVRGPVPRGMQYDKYPNSEMERLSVVDPEEPIKEVGGSRIYDRRAALTEYFAKNITYGFGANGRPLRAPRVERNPNVSDPHTVAFLDYAPRPPKAVDVAFVSSRQHGHHHAERLIRHMASLYPEADLHFGKVMNKHIWAIGDALESEGRKVVRSRNF